MEFLEKNPSDSIKEDTVDENGFPIGLYREIFQGEYKEGKLKLSEQKIKKLIEMHVLSYSRCDVKTKHNKYGISEAAVKHILKKYGDIENFIKDYKSGKIVLDESERKKCDVELPQGIALSSKDIRAKQKRAYFKLLANVCPEEEMAHLREMGYVNLDDVDKLIQMLPEKMQTILIQSYGLDGQGTRSIQKIAAQDKTSYQNIGGKRSLLLKRLRPIFSGIVKNKERLEHIDSFEEQILQEHKNIKIEQLNLSGAAYFALKRANINTMEELDRINDEELIKIKNITKQKIGEIRQKIEAYRANIDPEEKKMKFMVRISKLKKEQEAYKKALNNYETIENIFNPEQIINATIVNKHRENISFEGRQEDLSNSSKKEQNNHNTELSKRRKTLEELQQEYYTLKEQAATRDEILECLKELLELKGVILPSKISYEKIRED